LHQTRRTTLLGAGILGLLLAIILIKSDKKADDNDNGIYTL